MGQTECQAYNSLGQLQFKADFKGQVTEFLYDPLGRLQQKNLYPSGEGGIPTGNPCDFTNLPPTPDKTISFSYDQLGRQSQVEEKVGTTSPSRLTTFAYDPHGRLSSVTSPEGTVSYEYDPITGRKQRTFTANSDTLYNYDELGRLKTVTVHKQNASLLTTPQITSYTYNKVGSRSAIHYPNNTKSEYQYDSLNRLTELVNLDFNVGGASSPRLLSSYQYQLSPNGRRTGVTETRLEPNNTYSSTGITYTYDTLNRLIQEASGSTLPEANFNTTYTYDIVGNRLQKSSNVGANSSSRPESFTYAYNNNDQLLTEDQNLNGDLRSLIYDYDANGSLILKSVTGVNSETNAYNYNLENRLSSATISRVENGNTLDISTAYKYNQSGIRVSADSSITNRTTNAIFDNHKTFIVDSSNHTGYAQVLEQFEGLSGTPTVSYTIGNDVISQATSNGTDVLMYDGHGSTRLLTDSSGNITDRYSYDAYGIMLGGNPTNLQPTASSLLYSGEAFDVNLQQQYLRARWYDQNNGRFNRLDPFIGKNSDPQSLHKYVYTHGDPVNGTDPSGRFTLLGLLIGSSIGLSLRTIYDETVLAVGGAIIASLEGVQAGKTAEEILFDSAITTIVSVTGFIAFGMITRALSLRARKATIFNRTAEHANAPYLADGKKPPYQIGSPVMDMVTAKKVKAVRVFTQGSTQPTSKWMTTLDQIDGLHPLQIKDFLSLEDTPTHILEVDIPANTKIRTGITSAIFGNRGGATQIELLETIPIESFGIPKPL